MHAQRPDEVALHEPERLGQEQRARCLDGDPVDDLAPELDRDGGVERPLGHRVLGARRDPAPGARQRMPQPLDVSLGEDHRRVEADDRELAGDVEDRLDDRLADVGPQVVELGGVVPREARAVVAVVDEPLVAGRAVHPLEHDRRVRPVPVMVLEEDRDPVVPGQVRATERVGRIRRRPELEEPVRVLDDPAGVDAHVVRDHVAGEPDATIPRPCPEVRRGSGPAEVRRDVVVVQRIRGGERLRVAAPSLDLARGSAPLPDADQPQPGDAGTGEPVELLVGDRVERPDLPRVRPRELVEPDVGALGHEHDARHPGHVGAEALRLRVGLEAVRVCATAAPEGQRVERTGPAATAGPADPATCAGDLLLLDHPEPDIEPVEQPGTVPVTDERPPARADERELSGQRARRRANGCAEEGHQILAIRPERLRRREVTADRIDHVAIAGTGRARQRGVVHQRAQRPDGRIARREPGQQELADAFTGRSPGCDRRREQCGMGGLTRRRRGCADLRDGRRLGMGERGRGSIRRP